MALDIALTLHDQIWSLLEADDDFAAAVKAGNRLKQTDKEYQARADLKRQPADYPCCIVRITSESLNSPPSQVPNTFGMNAASYTTTTCDHGVPGSLTASIKLIYDKIHLGAQSPIESYVNRALWSVGPRLGLNAWVNGFKIDLKRADKKNDETGHVFRTVAEFALAINIRPRLSQLTA